MNEVLKLLTRKLNYHSINPSVVSIFYTKELCLTKETLAHIYVLLQEVMCFDANIFNIA